MKAYDFLCGGDYGAWESQVTVNLTEEEEKVLLEFAKDGNNEFIDWDPPMDKIYFKVLAELDKQCDDLNADNIIIRVPFGLRTDGL